MAVFVVLILEERRLRRVSKDEASWFERAQERLLTVRGLMGARVKKKARMRGPSNQWLSADRDQAVLL
jgi:hypothetical protein